MNLSLFSAGDLLICTVPFPDTQRIHFLLGEGGAIGVNIREADKDYRLFFRLTLHTPEIVIGQLHSPADNQTLLSLLEVLPLDRVAQRLSGMARNGSLFGSTKKPF